MIYVKNGGFHKKLYGKILFFKSIILIYWKVEISQLK